MLLPYKQSVWLEEQELVEQIFYDIKPDLFVLVHYFGQPTREVEWLINPTSQHMVGRRWSSCSRPGEGVGQIGDAVLYSLTNYFLFQMVPS